MTGNRTTTESYVYDARGRISSFSNDAGQNITYAYDNRKVTTLTNGRTYIKTFDAWGGIKSVSDPLSSIAYTYSSVGKPKSVSTGDAVFSIFYDAIGNQAGLTDPNAGAYTYTYDAAGRVKRHVDGKGTVTENNYDALGRLATTTIDGVATTYTYGSTGYDLLRLTKVQTGNNYVAYTYDRYGRTLTEKRNVDGNGLLEFTYGYNARGELSSTLYPGGVQVNRQYDAYGNLSKVLAGTQAVWESTSATGTVSTSLLGGSLTSTRTYDSSGMLTNLKTEKGSTVLHNMDYVFDGATGNLTSRSGMLSQVESFTFDNLDRLTTVKQGLVTVMNMDYKPNGNVNSKTGLGVYGYGTHPHAVTSVENTGNLISSENQVITYTPFNKVSGINEKIGADNLSLTFTYGPDRQRWKTELKKNGLTEKTIIFTDSYESITENGVNRQLYYINGGNGLAAVYVKQSGQTDKIYYVHADHLGSIIKLTDGNGTEVFKASYDAWGNQTITNNTFAFHRGYTGHEHLKEFGLVNMNGRMYDPTLGRFLSPDPFVQMPDFSQSFNRYSYCLNNPLKYVDPNGEAWWVIPIIAAAVFATGNTIAHAIRGDIHNFGNGLKYFSQGALTGFALGTVYQFAPAVPWVGNTIRASMNAYLISQAGITSAGVIGGAFHGIGGIKRAIKITYGNFYLDENNWLGGVFQGVLRHTWEMPQTLLGHAYTQTMNMFGGVDRVDYLGGATFATNENADKSDGVTFGNFININNRDKIEGDFDNYMRLNPIYMHEYGHTIDSHLWGISYLLSIGVPSLISASSKSSDEHRGSWTETRANRRAAKYFGKYYGVTWNSWPYPEYYLH